MSDLISRQAAIDFIDAGRLVNPNEPRWSDNEVVAFLKSRPSAERRGRWIHKDPSGTSCSKCGRLFPLFMGLYDYCPNCGARMSPPDEE